MFNGGFKKAVKPIVFIVCLLPVAWVIWLAFTPGPAGSGLGANPQEYINRYLGDWALRMLLIALAITPLRLVLGWSGAMRFRRMTGLYAFFYAFLHLTSYVVLDQTFDWQEIWNDILKRNYITVGMISLILFIPLAATSTNGMIKRVGAKRWRKLHKLVYIIAPLTCLHFFMMRKGVQTEPLVYAGIATALLAVRLRHWMRVKFRRSASLFNTLHFHWQFDRNEIVKPGKDSSANQPIHKTPDESN
ncbi:MAG: sulfoxide reductase heme-binding subunit YedZ [Rhodospirillales bacterium]|nr:sulfoxide reductase heme-binding subunit YedZ [Rhodospirillales bacterium]